MVLKGILTAAAASAILLLSPISTYAGTVFYNDVPKDCDVMFVGDSRTVGMMQSIKSVNDEKTGYICEVGKGLAWLGKKAEKHILSGAKKGTTVIFNLGVNDVGNADKYVEEYNELTSQLKKAGCRVYFETVNPVGANCKTLSNRQIDRFNKKMTDELDCSVIDTNSMLKEKGYSAPDGLHYTADTYRTIYKSVIESISE